jgi:hypothetical protein
MDGCDGLAMRVLAVLLSACLLSGCCALDPGDSTDISTYWDGCWAATKDNKHGQIYRPSDSVKMNNN